jgi:hypothetical protein
LLLSLPLTESRFALGARAMLRNYRRMTPMKSDKWVPYSEHDELVRAMNELDYTRAIVEAAITFVEADQMAHHGPYSKQKKGALASLYAAVSLYQEKDL